MKILHLSTSDIEGGAARAANRLHEGLKAIGADSQMLVRAKFSTDRKTIAELACLYRYRPYDFIPGACRSSRGHRHF